MHIDNTKGIMYLAILFALITIVSIGFTVRVAYVIKNDDRRQRLLNNQKDKNGQQAYDIYNRVYTKKFLFASMLISISWALYVLQKLTKIAAGRHAVLTLIIDIVALTTGIAGVILASRALRTKN